MGRTSSGSSSRARAPVTRSQPVGHRPLTGTSPIAGKTLVRDADGRDPRGGRAAGGVRRAARRPPCRGRHGPAGHPRRPRRAAPPRAGGALGGVAPLARGGRRRAALATGRAHGQRRRLRGRLARGARHHAGAYRAPAPSGSARRPAPRARGSGRSADPPDRSRGRRGAAGDHRRVVGAAGRGRGAGRRAAGGWAQNHAGPRRAGRRAPARRADRARRLHRHLRPGAHLGGAVGRAPRRVAGHRRGRLRRAVRVRPAAARALGAARRPAAGQRRRERAGRGASAKRDLDRRRAALRGAIGARRQSGQGAAGTRGARRRGSG